MKTTRSGTGVLIEPWSCFRVRPSKWRELRQQGTTLYFCFTIWQSRYYLILAFLSLFVIVFQIQKNDKKDLTDKKIETPHPLPKARRSVHLPPPPLPPPTLCTCAWKTHVSGVVVDCLLFFECFSSGVLIIFLTKNKDGKIVGTSDPLSIGQESGGKYAHQWVLKKLNYYTFSMYSRSWLVREHRIILNVRYLLRNFSCWRAQRPIIAFGIELASKKNIIGRCCAQAPVRPTTQTQKRAKIK